MVHKKVLFVIIILFAGLSAISQDKWDLKRCVEYALANNISVKQADIQARITELTMKQSRLSQYPSLSASASTSVNGGRSIDPTTNLFTQQQILSAGFSLSTNMNLFNWFSLKNLIAGNQFETEAGRASVDKLKNDIALNVATAYLLILVSQEQANISGVAVQQTLQNLNNIRKRVEAGSLPELNLAELEAQLARDSSSLITAQATVQQNILQLKAILNLDAAEPFNVDMPPLDQIPIESLADLEPESVYALALVNLPQQKVNDLRIKAAEKYAASARGQMYPSFSLFGGLGSNYSNVKFPGNVTRTPTGNFEQTGAIVTVAGTQYDVMAPIFNTSVTTTRMPLGSQISDNFRQNIGIGLSVPIFNWGNQRTFWKKSLLNVQNLELQKELDSRTIKQDIYRAYTDASSAIQKFGSAKKSVETAQKAYNFAQKRYELDLLSTIDYLTNQNNLTRAKVELALAQVDYVFRLKLLEFYKGQGIRLQ